jgi:hypothetical protein
MNHLRPTPMMPDIGALKQKTEWPSINFMKMELGMVGVAMGHQAYEKTIIQIIMALSYMTHSVIVLKLYAIVKFKLNNQIQPTLRRYRPLWSVDMRRKV